MAFSLGSASESSGQHVGRRVATVVRLSARKAVRKARGKNRDGLTSFGVETFGMCSVGTANVVASRDEAK